MQKRSNQTQQLVKNLACSHMAKNPRREKLLFREWIALLVVGGLLLTVWMISFLSAG